MVTLDTEIITTIFAWTRASDEGSRVNRGDFAGLNVLAGQKSGPGRERGGSIRVGEPVLRSTRRRVPAGRQTCGSLRRSIQQQQEIQAKEGKGYPYALLKGVRAGKVEGFR
jgi:hypothetical protein